MTVSSQETCQLTTIIDETDLEGCSSDLVDGSSAEPQARAQPSPAIVAYRKDFADAALALTQVGLGSAEHRELVDAVAAERLSADDAVKITCQRAGVRLRAGHPGRFTAWEHYERPGSLVLRSRLIDDEHPDGIASPELFRRLEGEFTRLRLVELAIDPVPGVLDYEHMKTIHWRIFHDLYDWAGEERIGPDVPMVRWAPDVINFAPGDPAAPMVKYTYYSGPELARSISVVYAQLDELSRRKNISRRDLIDLMSEYAGELQTIHSFRDGNYRALYVFAMQYYQLIGYPANPADFVMGTKLREQTIHARYLYQATTRHDALSQTLDEALGGSEG